MQSKLRSLTYLGPAAMVSVGYMDPGNWATDIEGGARFGYQLLWVLAISNAMAMLLQNLSARLGIVTGLNLASACRSYYPQPLTLALWALAELAIIACDVAEVLGSAVALQLLFGLPLMAGATLTTLDVLIILGLQQRGMRALQAGVLTLVGTIAICLGLEVWLSSPSFPAILRGFVPKLQHLNGGGLYVAIGMLGATVMPHNLYLHSALVSRQSQQSPAEINNVLRKSARSTVFALNLAFLVNAAILILAAAVFSVRQLEVTSLGEAHRLLTPLMGTSIAAILFAVALLCAGQSATITGTLAGQIVMEGFLNWRVSPIVRRIITRSLALIPALAVLGATGEAGTMQLLLASQVILSLQLPFAIIPLLRLTGSRAVMADFATSKPKRIVVGLCALFVTGANAALILHIGHEAQNPAVRYGCLGGGALATLLLIYTALVPLRTREPAGYNCERALA